jgi:hypothetical protein
VSTYVPLGSRNLTGVADNTGNNTGNWTVSFTPDVLNCNLPYFEVCHIVVAGAGGSNFGVYIDLQFWDTNQNGFLNSWDPAVPMPLRPGQTLYFYYSDPITDNTPPVITVWLRYDQDIRANAAAMLNQPTAV